MARQRISATAFALFVVGTGLTLTLPGCGRPGSSSGENPAPAAGGPLPAAPPDHLVVYYFHGNVRCPTCQLIESYGHEALTTGFGDELKSGRIEWKTANFEEPENTPWAKEFSLQASSLVLVAFKDGQRQAWKDLSQVWQLVSEKAEFVAYVQNETRMFLQARPQG